MRALSCAATLTRRAAHALQVDFNEFERAIMKMKSEGKPENLALMERMEKSLKEGT